MEHLQQRRQAIGFVTPLRYPGGKRKLFPFFCDLIEHNNLSGAHYVEPFAGGAGLALSLLVSGCVKVVHLNDLDVAIYTFWKTVLEETEELCRRIEEVPIDVTTWERQREIIEQPDQHTEVDVAFATLFLNRTNRSGILRGGIIGGKEQTGKWKMDARFNREELIRRIRRISAYKDRIKVYNQEAIQFLQSISQYVPASEKSLIYADPPYYAKGHTLYYNHYRPNDHWRLAQTMRNLSCPWVVSYDDVEAVYEFYQGTYYLRYQLHYTAQTRRRSGEVMFLQGLVLPPIEEKGKWWRPMYVVGSSARVQA
ncbi:MAG TPA: DNA adenine methylase [Anaerolineae bacterium]|nr:DNA adenine methylase [Anaerolineae bacterium]